MRTVVPDNTYELDAREGPFTYNAPKILTVATIDRTRPLSIFLMRYLTLASTEDDRIFHLNIITSFRV